MSGNNLRIVRRVCVLKFHSCHHCSSSKGGAAAAIDCIGIPQPTCRTERRDRTKTASAVRVAFDCCGMAVLHIIASRAFFCGHFNRVSGVRPTASREQARATRCCASHHAFACPERQRAREATTASIPYRGKSLESWQGISREGEVQPGNGSSNRGIREIRGKPGRWNRSSRCRTGRSKLSSQLFSCRVFGVFRGSKYSLRAAQRCLD